MIKSEYQALRAALLWHMDAGADMPLAATPVPMLGISERQNAEPEYSGKQKNTPPQSEPPLGASESRENAAKLAANAQTLETLQAAIAGFDGLGLKDTAIHLVFADGPANAAIMLIGDAPGTEDDRAGKPFAGAPGVLLDQILNAAGLARTADTPNQAVYLSTILNWRPPGNRTPAQAEITACLPFIERHIQLVKPKILILAGTIAAQSLLGTSETISKIRGRWHEYTPQTPELQGAFPPIPALATYHPGVLLKTPAQKRQVWADMLALLEKRETLGLIR